MIRLFEYLFIPYLALFSNLEVQAQNCEAHFERGINEVNGDLYLYTTPLENIFFVKIISSQSTNYYLTAQNTGHSVKERLVGIKLMLGDNSTIDRADCQVATERDSGHTFGHKPYRFSSYFALNMEEITRIKNVGIRKFKLYRYEFSLSRKKQKMIKDQAKCLAVVN